MKLVVKKRPKREAQAKSKENAKVFRLMRRLDNGDLLLAGFVHRYKKLYGKLRENEMR